MAGMNSTAGPWIVSEGTFQLSGKVVMVKSTVTGWPVAMCGLADSNLASEATANAALISAAPEMLDTLIAIQEVALNNLNGTMDANTVAALISDVFEKMANEAGIEGLPK